MAIVEREPSAEHLRPPQLFPIRQDALVGVLSDFSGMDAKHVEAISRSRAYLLGSDSPLGYVLSGAMRPEIDESGDNVKQAYQEGVCIGDTLVRAVLRQTLGQDADAFLDSGAAYDFEAASVAAAGRRLVRQQRRSLLARSALRHDDRYDFTGLFESDEAASYIGVLTSLWLLRGGHGYLDTEAVIKGVDEYISVGIKDALLFYRDAMRQDASPSEHMQRTLAFDARSITERVQGDPLLAARPRLHNSFTGHSISGEDITDVSGNWSHAIRAGTQLQTVGVFRGRQTADGQGGLARKVDARSTDRYTLQPRDFLVVMDRRGCFVPLAQPFIVGTRIAPDDTGVELVSLVRRGKVVALAERDIFSMREMQRLGRVEGDLARLQLHERRGASTDLQIRVTTDPRFLGSAATLATATSGPHLGSVAADLLLDGAVGVTTYLATRRIRRIVELSGTDDQAE